MTDCTCAVTRAITLSGFLVDQQAWDRLGEAFTEDAVLALSGGDGKKLEGLAEIGSFMAAFPSRPLAHVTTDHLVTIDVDGASATVESKVFLPQRDGSAAYSFYTDELVLTEDGWRIRHRRIGRLPSAA